jgi:hypothetical protein
VVGLYGTLVGVCVFGTIAIVHLGMQRDWQYMHVQCTSAVVPRSLYIGFAAEVSTFERQVSLRCWNPVLPKAACMHGRLPPGSGCVQVADSGYYFHRGGVGWCGLAIMSDHSIVPSPPPSFPCTPLL